MNEYINITADNAAKEHLCCAIGDKKHSDGVCGKKEWISERLKEGHVFRKLNAQGKVFIEYAPLETAWTSVIGENFIYIYCLWVAGSFKGHGYAKELLSYAINDAKEKGKSGLCVISSKKKKPFISEKGFFEKFGFQVCDSAGDYELMCLSFDGKQPRFTDSAKLMRIDSEGLVVFYSPQCPYTCNCVREIEEYRKTKGANITLIKIDSSIKAKEVPCVFNNWANFLNGKFVSNTLLNANSLDKLLSGK